MRGRIRFGSPWLAALVFAASWMSLPHGPLVTTALAADAEYCVRCKQPGATYRCKLRGSGVNQSDALKLYCVVQLTKAGNHASCSVKKAASCKGELKVYTYDGPALPANIANDPRIRSLNERATRDSDTFEDNRGDQPKSLFELGGRAYDASKRGLSNAGAAIGLGGGEAAPKPAGQPAPPPQAAQPAPSIQETPQQKKNFARRSYDCMVSLFRDCGDTVTNE